MKSHVFYSPRKDLIFIATREYAGTLSNGPVWLLEDGRRISIPGVTLSTLKTFCIYLGTLE